MSMMSGCASSVMAAAWRIESISLPKIWMPMGRSYSKMSSFARLFAASRINPSELMNSVYMTSAPYFLHSARNGGSLTSSIGASKKGNSAMSMSPMRTT